jgi:hypothetical protein
VCVRSLACSPLLIFISSGLFSLVIRMAPRVEQLDGRRRRLYSQAVDTGSNVCSNPTNVLSNGSGSPADYNGAAFSQDSLDLGARVSAALSKPCWRLIDNSLIERAQEFIVCLS